MKYALISDLHANLPAVEAVLRDIEHRSEVGAVYHLGDLVGYAPWPNEVVAAIRGAAIGGVAGNYDSTVGTDYKHCVCRYEDPHQEELSHLSDLFPDGGHMGVRRLVLVHGTPTLNTVYWTEDRSDSFCLKMAEHAGLKAGDAIAFGHTHRPWYRIVEGLHFVNTGSVGRPKDGDWRAGYVLVDVTSTGVGIEFVRVPYDLERAAATILASDLPDAFADYLRTGGQG